MKKNKKTRETKPPLGITPEWLWREARLWELAAAITRYREAGRNVPDYWVAELHTLSGLVHARAGLNCIKALP